MRYFDVTLYSYLPAITFILKVKWYKFRTKKLYKVISKYLLSYHRIILYFDIKYIFVCK